MYLNRCFVKIKRFSRVCSMKQTIWQQIPKARLVKEFKEPLCLVLSIIVQKKRYINAIDIETISVQREKINRELFILPPKEANVDKIWLLQKCPYGLVDAPRKWYSKVKIVLTSNLKMPKSDLSLFYYFHNNEL